MEIDTANTPTTAHFLVHNEGDHVGVAVEDVRAGPARVVFMDTDRTTEISVIEPIPLGHKVALRDLPAEAEVIEYGVRIGVARAPISAGTLVHVHNLRSARWVPR
jgi:(2R)-sulfolactate sulfo-lyase subunit alpha